MTQDNNSIETLQAELFENPRSLNFTLLAEKYLEKELFSETEALVRTSLKFHPTSVSGYILLSRSLSAQSKQMEAIDSLKMAIKLAPDNIKALSSLAEVYVETKNGKSALKCYKQILFHYPHHPIARRAVARLEVLSADEYEDDLFEMQPIQNSSLKDIDSNLAPSESKEWAPVTPALERILAFIDALTVRLEIQKALEMLSDCTKKYGNHPEIETRRLKLSEYEKPSVIFSKQKIESSTARSDMIRQKKLDILNELLRRIEDQKQQQLST